MNDDSDFAGVGKFLGVVRSICHRPMVPLEHERPNRCFVAQRAAGDAFGQLDLFVDDNVVQHHFVEDGIRGFLFAVEARGLEVDHELLPFAGFLARIHLWNGDAVNRAHVVHGEFLDTKTVEDLHFVSAHELDAGVGSLRDHNLDLDNAIAECLLTFFTDFAPRCCAATAWAVGIRVTVRRSVGTARAAKRRDSLDAFLERLEGKDLHRGALRLGLNGDD